MQNLIQIDESLSKYPFFYLSTMDGDMPKCRPMGLHMIFDNRLLFGVGDFKEVYAQLKANPAACITASDGENFLRYYGKVEWYENDALVADILANTPAIQSIYNAQTGHKLKLFCLVDSTVEFHGKHGLIEKSSGV